MLTLDRQTELGKEPLAFRPGHRYALLVDARGITLSVHDDVAAGLLWLSGTNPRGDYRPPLLDLAQAVALRDALGLWIADQSPNVEGDA